MRRQRRSHVKGFNFFYVAGAIVLVLLIVLVIMYKVYNKHLKEMSESMLSTEQIIGLRSVEEDDNSKVESTSFDLSKTIEDVQKENTIDVIEEDEAESIPIEPQEVKEENVEQEKVDVKKELSFAYPVDGEIVKNFGMDNLQYSTTLEEWTVHQGIDIKADRTTVVKAAEEGTVTAIKNDPRFGLTVIIEHQDGFKTVYSNLLTTEFVTEDEKVNKGQSLGTVGNSAVFEIADEPHLHFEMLKDGEYIDPTTYLK